jgi:hypothetical protein
VEPFPALIFSNNIRKHSENQYAESSLHLYIVRGSNNTQTTLPLNGGGYGSRRILHRGTSTGKRQRGSVLAAVQAMVMVTMNLRMSAGIRDLKNPSILL